MLHHDIGIEIVAGDAAILIRPLAEEKVGAGVTLIPGIPALPKSGSLHIHLCGMIQIKGFVA